MATVIKTTDQDPILVKRLETVNVSDHLAEAKLVVEKARDEARLNIAQARRQATDIHTGAAERGYRAGFERGYLAGLEKGRQQAFEDAQRSFATQQEQLLRTLNAIVDEYERNKRDLSIRAQGDVLDFAVKVAAHVTKRIGQVDRQAAAANLESALQRVGSPTDVLVRVNPIDAESMRDFAASFADRVSQAASMTIKEDDSVACGGCVLQTADTQVDATIDTQLDQIARLLVAAKGDEV